ncbi:hypothetical protein [Aliarcobacter cryaerophilus]|uniref:hypothetical protein n=1 Tax=Aliarcobacter cryaerophilus TaxID=28198 RepID=UPI0021B55698|nr:hypothetical protein [Aliarcobacter cryaerophilus]MCT7541780.1 hypothetical protein [Aliarcobacter cryaerophilus]
MDFITWIFFKELMTVATGVVATGFSFYFAWQKLGTSVNASYSISGDIFSEERLDNIILKNNKNKPIEIFTISALIDNKYYIEVERLDTPIILKGLEVVKINTSPVSEWGFEKQENSLFSYEKKIEIYISTSDSLIKCNSIKVKKFDKLKNLEIISKITRIHNGLVYNRNVLYIINYISDKNINSVLVLKDGIMSKSIFGFNVLSEELLESEKKIEEYYQSQGLKVFVKKVN